MGQPWIVNFSKIALFFNTLWAKILPFHLSLAEMPLLPTDFNPYSRHRGRFQGEGRGRKPAFGHDYDIAQSGS